MRTIALSVATALFFAVAGTALAADSDVTAPKLFNVKLTNKIFKVGDKNMALITKAKKKEGPDRHDDQVHARGERLRRNCRVQGRGRPRAGCRLREAHSRA